jgi:hypothetical protein
MSAPLQMQPQPQPAKREVEVHISLENGKIKVDPDRFYLEKHFDQEVHWICTSGDGSFLVEFGTDSPFYESQFNEDSPVSGLVRRQVAPHDHRIYKYTVRVGGEELDPGGSIKR